MNFHKLLTQRAADDNPVRVGLIGCGKFGTMFLTQALQTTGLHVVGIADLKGIAEFNPPKNAPEAAILKKATALGLAIGEVDGQVRVAAVLKAADETTAGHLENILRGGASLIVLGADLDPKVAELASTVKTRVARDGSHVRVYLGVPANLVKKQLAEEMSKNKAAQADEGDGATE